MRRRAFLPSSRPGHNSSKSSPSSSSSSLPLSLIRGNSNTLVLLLSAGILFWIFLCFHIHLQLSIAPTPLGARLRSRFARPHTNPNGGTTNTNNKNRATTNDDYGGLSACLLVNDENPRLPEWIAYHYQILPLRSLTVAVDPASRSSPAEILGRWSRMGTGLDAEIWEEGRYMPGGGDGACDGTDPNADCLKQHRRRQQHFVRACMADFQRRNKTWVLLTDVDEYITFNTLHDGGDRSAPLDLPPPGVPVLNNWTWHVTGLVRDGIQTTETTVNGILSNLPREGWHGKRNGDPKTTLGLIDKKDDIFYGAYGSIFTDTAGNRWFLRDDFAWRDALDVPPDRVPKGVPIIKNSSMEGEILHGTINGEPVEIRTNWRDVADLHSRRLLAPISPAEMKTVHGGHTMRDVKGKRYYLERDDMLWPPHLSTRQSMEIRKRLPSVADGTTVLDVLNREMRALGTEYADEALGPCLGMPRLLYGSFEGDRDDPSRKSMAPEGFDDGDFVTLRYRWHSLPDNRVNKYQKNIVDMSRIPSKKLRGEAENIHSPVKYYCRDKQPPRYATSFFRVNHYLDSFEAYSYRNDARADKRQCKKCYDDKGREAAKEMDEDVRPWLRAFVENVGAEKARMLLAGAGDFVHLPDPSARGSPAGD